MQGLPIQFLNQKVDLGSANGKVKSSEQSELLNGIGEGEVANQGSENFGDLFSGLIQSKNQNNQSGKNEEALARLQNGQLDTAESSEFISGADELSEKMGNAHVRSELNKASQNFDSEDGSQLSDLLGRLKNAKKPLEAEANRLQFSDDSYEVINEEAEQSPLNFLIKESGRKNNSAQNSQKVMMSSEDFLTHKNQETNLLKNQAQAEGFDINKLLNKSQGQVVKGYGQKQDILNNGLIKNTSDLAFGERRSKINHNELRNSEMSTSHELSMIKESFIPNVQAVNGVELVDNKSSTPVLDLSKVNISNVNEVIKTISNYVEQAQFANRDSLDLNVRHESLGEFKIQVNKLNVPGNNQIDLQIVTSTQEGHEFFVKNESGLIKTLSQAGINLSDLKIVSGGEMAALAKGDSSSGNQSQQNHHQREFTGQQSFGDSSNGSERRKNLWDEARAQQQRYGA